MTAYLWEFIGVGFLMYFLALALPFASLLWVHGDQALHGW